MTAEAFTIALATPEDAEEMVRVHYASVHGVCSKDYQDECLQVWSPEPSEKRFMHYRDWILDTKNYFLVAREASGAIAGFGSVDRNEAKITTLYILPKWIGKGLGSRLLNMLEAELARLGRRKIQLMSTLNAEKFYQRSGYKTLRSALHNRQGVAIPALDMEKEIKEGIAHA